MLASDMRRLCKEIVALRKGRSMLMSNLVCGNRDRKQSVGELCAEIGRARGEMAKRTKSERLGFLHSLARAVKAQRREMRMDLAGARRAWVGHGA